MIEGAPVAIVTSNKYIILFQETYTTQNNLYYCNKIRLKKQPIIQMLHRKIKLKQINIFRIFVSTLRTQKNGKR